MSDQSWNNPGTPPSEPTTTQGWGQSPPGQPSPGQPPHGQPPHGEPSYGQPSYGQQSYGQQPGWPQQGSQQAVGEAKGFFGALFDFSFNHFVTPSIVKVVYILGAAALILGWLFFIITGFIQSAGFGLVVLLLGWIPVLVYLAFLRMTLEFYYALVRMSEDIHRRSL